MKPRGVVVRGWIGDVRRAVTNGVGPTRAAPLMLMSSFGAAARMRDAEGGTAPSWEVALASGDLDIPRRYSWKTMASKTDSLAPRFQASGGSPALMQPWARKVSRSQPLSTGT